MHLRTSTQVSCVLVHMINGAASKWRNHLNKNKKSTWCAREPEPALDVPAAASFSPSKLFFVEFACTAVRLYGGAVPNQERMKRVGGMRRVHPLSRGRVLGRDYGESHGVLQNIVILVHGNLICGTGMCVQPRTQDVASW